MYDIFRRFVIISNRLPISVIRRKGTLNFATSSGGLATGLGSFYKSYDSLWIGWPGIINNEDAEKETIKTMLYSEKMHPVFLTKNDVEKYYDGFCNKTIWPLFHYFIHYTVYDKLLWEAYKHANNLFCEELLKIIEHDDIIWVHDYHLMLLPKLIREKIPDATIGFFLHIPFPSFEIFRSLPWRKEILNGILGADLIGFHTYDYARHFLSAINRLLGFENRLGQMIVEDRIINVDSFPIGIDFDKFFKASKESGIKKEITKIRNKIGDRKIILSIDRLDYTKGIPQRLEAFNLFLDRYPEYREKVTLILVAVPSRTKVEYYRRLKKQVDELVGNINGKHGRIGWTPILYLYRFLPFSTLSALYNVADVALVTPFRDGMNLIAKEYIATKADSKGVLILSETAGAAKMLSNVLSINPNNIDGIAEALKEALVMPEDEQIKRNIEMQNQLKRYNIIRWVEGFMDRLIYTKKIQSEMSAKLINSKVREKLINDYHRSRRRLIILDYDGTLIPFAESPELAKPDDELLELLERLADSPKNEVVIISGRDKETLQKWFCNLNVELIAEHGAWFHEKGSHWEMVETLIQDWKEKIFTILESYVDRTPGTHIETKEFSIVWHYRKADPELAKIRARELVETLSYFVANLDLQVLEGSKVIEVKNSEINKGKTAMRWIAKESWSFILAIGDDRTDEDIFEILPDSAYSIKVGLSSTAAKFNLNSSNDVRILLKEMVGGIEL